MKKINVIFLGSGEFARHVLRGLRDCVYVNLAAVITQPDKPAGRGKIMSPTLVKTYCIDNGVSVLDANSSSDLIEQFKLLDKPDILIVADFGVILSEDALNYPNICAVNVHPSLLPKYRGATPIHSALRNGDLKTGVSIMKMTKGMDSGPIFVSSEMDIPIGDNYDLLMERLGQFGSNLLCSNLSKIADSELVPVIQDELNASYCAKISKSDGLIDFDELTSDEIINMYRAFYCWPKTFFMKNDKKFQITSLVRSDIDLLPSEFLFQSGLLNVGTKSGSLNIVKFKPESKNEMLPADFLRGNPDFLSQSYD